MRPTVAAQPAEVGRGGVAPSPGSGPCLLEQPGILVSMVSPFADGPDADGPDADGRDPGGLDPDRQGAGSRDPEARGRAGAHRAGRFAARAVGWCVGLAVGVVVAASIADFAGRLRELHELSTFARRDWWGVVAIVTAMACIVRALAGTRRDRRLLVAIVSAIGAAAAMQRFVGAHEGWFGIGLQAALLGGALGLLRPRRVRFDSVSAAIAAVATAMLMAALPVGEQGAALTGLLAIVSTLIALALVAAIEPPRMEAPPAAVRRQGVAARLLAVVAIVAAGLVVSVAPTASGLPGYGVAIGAAYAAAAAVVVAALAGRCHGLLIGSAIASLLLTPALSPTIALPADREQVLARAGTAVAVYDRATQEMQLFEHGERIDAAGPDRVEAPLCAVVLQTLLRPGDRVHVIGVGIGRTVELLQQIGALAIEVTDVRPQVDALRPRLLGDGPVPPATTAPSPIGAHCHVGGLLATLAALPDDSRQALVLAEPLAQSSELRVLPETQRELRRVVGRGLVVQVASLDRTPPSMLARWFASAVSAHAWNGLFVVGEAAVLVSAAAPPDWSAVPPLAAWSDDARWLLHLAHVGDIDDLRRALTGVLRPPAADEPAFGEVAGRREANAVLLARCEPIAAPAAPPSGSLLLRWIGIEQEAGRVALRLRELADDAAGRAEAQAAAARFLPFGAPTAALQAALGLPAADGVTLSDPQLACLRAFAIDPTFFDSLAPVFRSLPVPKQTRGGLEDLACLPPRPRLAELCVGTDPLAVALRARFASACARALIERLAAGPLPPDAAQSLRELADPFVLVETARALAARSAGRELLGLWRGDLPMPAALAQLLQGSFADREALALALRGRRDPSCHAVLAELLLAPELALRRLAGEALQQAVGDRVAYDPDWPPAARNEAAQRLRALHNRAP